MRHLSDIKPGQVIGRYEFLAPIAQGGMAAVWAARQRGSRGFSKVVAIKTMLPSISEDPRFERMFLDEAQIASRIRHGNVVEILDLGEENDILYLVMEWVDGESLSVVRRRAAERVGIPQRISARIVADVCAGLHAAHELTDDEGKIIGLVHRDVSPQNILVGYDGSVKVLDFGVAKVAGRTADTTSIGQARGKPPYMAPEQALGKPVDRRADLFSLGIVLYQLLVGRHPFRGENDIATLHNIISEQEVTKPREIVPTITQALEAIVLRAIHRDPACRFQTAQEFELALESALDGSLGRVRLEEVGRFMAETMGSTHGERRGAIRDAIRVADSAEQTRVDVSLAASSAPDASNSNNAFALEAEKQSEVSRESVQASSDSLSLIRSGDQTLDEPGQASLASGQKPTRRGWWPVILAMVAGALLAWGGAALVTKPAPPLPHSPLPSVVKTPELPSVQPSEHTAIEQTQPQPIPSTEARDARRAPSTRRNVGSGNRSGVGGGGNHQNGLPPIPSPGF